MERTECIATIACLHATRRTAPGDTCRLARAPQQVLTHKCARTSPHPPHLHAQGGASNIRSVELPTYAASSTTPCAQIEKSVCTRPHLSTCTPHLSMCTPHLSCFQMSSEFVAFNCVWCVTGDECGVWCVSGDERERAVHGWLGCRLMGSRQMVAGRWRGTLSTIHAIPQCHGCGAVAYLDVVSRRLFSCQLSSPCLLSCSILCPPSLVPSWFCPSQLYLSSSVCVCVCACVNERESACVRTHAQESERPAIWSRDSDRRERRQ